ncbi:unnamed protein product [Prorocentrum cordatum]|nr:unnamed protein product [Polarella glacialis]
MWRGVLHQPERYPGLSGLSSFEQFQAALHSDPRAGCARPCPSRGPTATPAPRRGRPAALADGQCGAPLGADACYAKVHAAIRYDVARHPELYPALAEGSGLAELREALRGWGELAEPCRRPCGAAREPRGEPERMPAAMQLAKRDCHTTIEGEPCHREVRWAMWAMRAGILERPEWYPNLSIDSSFEDFQSFLHGLSALSHVCPAPCKAQAAAAQTCHTAEPGESCHTEVTWAMTQGIRERPRWYPNLTQDSSFEDFQAFLHGLDLWSQTCPRPCDAPERVQQVCHTAVEGEACHQQVRWAMQHGIRESPTRYPSLTADSSFEDFQALLHGMDAWSKICPKPCEAPKRAQPLTPAEAQPVPLGEVVITHVDEYLYATQQDDSFGGRFVHTWMKGSLQEDPQARWNISKVGENYVIIHAGSFKGEYLYASQHGDSRDGHFARTWTKGSLQDDPQARWNISKVGRNYVITPASSLKNEYLYAAQRDDSHGLRYVHALMTGVLPADDPRALWTITPLAPEGTQQACRTAAEGEACHRQVRWAMQHGILEHPGWYPGLTANSSLEEFQAFLHGTDAWRGTCSRPCVPQGASAPQRRLPSYRAPPPEAQGAASASQGQAPERRSLPSYRTRAPEAQGPASRSEGQAPVQGCRTAAAGDACHEEVLWMKREGILLHPAWFPGLANDSSFEDVQAFLNEMYPIVQLCPDRPCRAADAAAEATEVAAVVKDAAVEAAEATARASEVAAEAGTTASEVAAEAAGGLPPGRRPPAAAGASASTLEGDREDLAGRATSPFLAQPLAATPAAGGEEQQEERREASEALVDAAPTRGTSSLEAPPPPNSSGCFVWLPSGCRGQRFPAAVPWKRDEWGQANRHSGDSRAACEARKRDFDAWCSVDDAVMLHVPGLPVVGPGEAALPQGGAPPLPRGAPAGAGAAGPPAGAPPPPAREGCHVWLPSGCRRHRLPAEWRWTRDEAGEALVPPAGQSEAACLARKGFYDRLCAVADAVMLRVPGAAREGSRPVEAGASTMEMGGPWRA